MKEFVFISDSEVINRLISDGAPEEVRTNMLKVRKGDFFTEDGYLVFERWLVERSETAALLDKTQNRNEFDTGDPKVSYDDLCKYQQEFEALHGKCDGFCMDSEVMQYQLELMQYCVERTHGMACP